MDLEKEAERLLRSFNKVGMAVGLLDQVSKNDEFLYF